MITNTINVNSKSLKPILLCASLALVTLSSCDRYSLVEEKEKEVVLPGSIENFNTFIPNLNAANLVY